MFSFTNEQERDHCYYCTAEGPTRNGKCPLAQAPIDGHLGRSLATMLLPYLPHQLYQGLDGFGLVLGEQQASCSLRIVVAVVLACTQERFPFHTADHGCKDLNRSSSHKTLPWILVQHKFWTGMLPSTLGIRACLIIKHSISLASARPMNQENLMWCSYRNSCTRRPFRRMLQQDFASRTALT